MSIIIVANFAWILAERSPNQGFPQLSYQIKLASCERNVLVDQSAILMRGMLH